MAHAKLTPVTFRMIRSGSAAVAAMSMSVAIGALRAQTLPPPPEYTYEVVSVRPADSNERGGRLGPGPQGGMRAQNIPVLGLLAFAYDVPVSQLADVPAWAKSDRFDVTFTPDREETSLGRLAPGEVEGVISRQRQRMQAILRDRFGLVMRAESREMPLCALTISKGGSKLTPAANDSPGMMTNRGRITAKGVELKMLTQVLSNQLGRPVIDETGLDGRFDFVIEWIPDLPIAELAGLGGPAGPGQPPAVESADGSSIFTALTEQLGLKLESRKGPAPVLVVEKIEKPEAN